MSLIVPFDLMSTQTNRPKPRFHGRVFVQQDMSLLPQKSIQKTGVISTEKHLLPSTNHRSVKSPRNEMRSEKEIPQVTTNAISGAAENYTNET